MLTTVLVKLESASESALEGLSKHRLLGPTPKTSDPGPLGWGLRTCIFNELPRAAGPAGPRILHFENLWPKDSGF